MYIRIPFLAVLIITVFQLVLYGIQNNEHSTKDLNEVLNIQLDDVTEVSMVNLSGEQRRTKDPGQIDTFIKYFNQYQYKRLRNDQTAYMPMKVVSINFHTDDDLDFIIPYAKEVLITHKVYRVKKGLIDEKDLLKMFNALPNH